MISAREMTLLAEMSGVIAARLGLHFPEDRWPELARGLAAAGKELGFGYPDGCAAWLRTRALTNRQIETLASNLTVGETYFFRDPKTFEALEREILPRLVESRSRAGRALRLWSAGCCTGEEPYSLAISCSRVVPNLQEWNISILATDINPKFLAKAEAGIYSQWSFRGAPPWLRDGFFSPAPGKKLAISPAVKRLVHFAHLNLAEDPYPALHNHTNGMDVIFCRNVLMYFTQEHQRQVVAALHRSLVDGGCLLVNPAEASTSLFPMFAMEEFSGGILYRKTSRPTPVESQAYSALPEPMPAVPAPEPAFTVAAAPPVTGLAVVPGPPDLSTQTFTESPHEEPLALARAYANQGRLEEALAACKDTLATERTNPAAHFLYATICDELGRLEEAIAALCRVLYLDQDFILAHHALGDLYRRIGEQRKSSRHLAVAFELLSARGRDEIVPESNGMTCGRLVESVRALAGG